MRLLFDTNVWSYIGDVDAQRAVDGLLREAGHCLVLSPSTLVEALQNPNAEARDRIVRAMAMARGERLRTEADRQGEEVIGEVRRLHPEWLRQTPHVHEAAQYRAFWTASVWKQATRHPGAFQSHYREWTEPVVQHILGTQESNRDRFRQDIPRQEFNVMDWWHTLPDGEPNPLPGWDGKKAEAWRVTVATIMRRELHVVPGLSSVGLAHRSTYADWVGAHVDLRAMYADEPRATRFFLEEVELLNMRRTWLAMFAVEVTQMFFKLSRGNALDQQHASYLLDCDLFLTADRRYRDCLETIRRQAPFPFAHARLVSGDPSTPIVDRISETINES